MSAEQRNWGGAPVGQLDALPSLERATVLYLRLWCGEAEGKAALWNEVAGSLGTEPGSRWLGAWEEFIAVLTRFARRPVTRHALGCRCLGADESAIATLVAAAAQGEREEAMLIGMLIVRPEMATVLAGLAETVGLGLKRMLAGPAEPAATHRPAPATRH
jgi:hypothetical protein